MNGSWVTFLVFGVLLLTAGLLAWLAFRRKGLIPAGACSCGYPSTGIESGTCPECGKPLAEEIERVEWKRRIAFFNRVVAWAAAVVLVGLPFTVSAIRLAGADETIACRTILVPKDGSFRSAVLRWNVKPARKAAPARTPAAAPATAPGSPGRTLDGAVVLELKSSADVTSVKSFTASKDVVSDAAGWVERTIAANPGSPAAAELAQAVATAASGAEMILAGGAGSQFTMIASGTVSTVASPRWVPIASIALWCLIFAWGVRAIARRVAGTA
ncbi:MAG: hypothetical protein HEQ23_07505 [Tepidisphaera sp.]